MDPQIKNLQFLSYFHVSSLPQNHRIAELLKNTFIYGEDHLFPFHIGYFYSTLPGENNGSRIIRKRLKEAGKEKLGKLAVNGETREVTKYDASGRVPNRILPLMTQTVDHNSLRQVC